MDQQSGAGSLKGGQSPTSAPSRGDRTMVAKQKNLKTIFRQWRHPMKNDQILDFLRRRLTEVENDLVDELVSGRIGRREFLRHGSVLGLSLPILGGIAGAVGLPLLSRSGYAATPGGTVRVACQVPAGKI